MITEQERAIEIIRGNKMRSCQYCNNAIGPEEDEKGKGWWCTEKEKIVYENEGCDYWTLDNRCSFNSLKGGK